MKFERGKDPKEALGIGIFSERHFDTLEEARAWVIQNHVAILGLDRLCDPWPTPEQFAELRDYVSKYICVPDWEFSDKSNKVVGGVANLYRELHEVRNSIGNIMNGNNR